MAFRSGFYDAVLTDGVYVPNYAAADFAEKFTLYFTDGVFYSKSDRLQVLAGTGLNLSVRAGAANARGYTTYNDAPVTVTLSAADAFNPRYDIIALRLNLTTKTFAPVVITGIPAANPAIPTVSSLSRTSTVYDIMLAYVYVRAGATSIIQSNITDTRGNSLVCGFATSTVDQIDTTTFWTQWQSRFNEFATEQESTFNRWFNEIQQSLESLTTTQLLARQDAVEAEVAKITDYYYICNGSNDRVTLQNLVLSFLNGTGDYTGAGPRDTLRIFVQGSFETVTGNFDVRPTNSTDRKVILDFANCDEITGQMTVYAQKNLEFINLKLTTSGRYAALEVNGALFRNCRIVSTRDVYTYTINGNDNRFVDCIITANSVTGFANCVYGENNEITGCDITAYSSNASAFGIRGTGFWYKNNVVVTSASASGLGTALGAIALYAAAGKTTIIGGNARAYCIASALTTTTTPSECIGLYIAGSVTEANLTVIALNLPFVARSGYANYPSLSTAAQARYNAAKINSGKYLFFGISAFKALSCYTKLPNWDLAYQFLIGAVSSAVGSNAAIDNARSFVNTMRNGYTGETLEYNTIIQNIPGSLT